MDYETTLILQQQEEFLVAAAVGNSVPRPNLVDVLSNLNDGVPASSSEPQTPMSLLQKFFLMPITMRLLNMEKIVIFTIYRQRYRLHSVTFPWEITLLSYCRFHLNQLSTKH